MRERTIAGTDLRVSEIGMDLRALASGWWGDTDDDEAVRLLREARSAGMTLFDASGAGRRGEAILARAFGGDESVVRVLSLDPDAPLGRRPRRSTEDQVVAFGARLDALGIAGVEVVLCRRHERAAADALLATGVVRAVAVRDGEPPAGLGDGLVHADVSLLDAPVVAPAEEDRRSILATNPLATGLLEDKYTPLTAFPSSDPRADLEASWLPEGLTRVAALRFLAEERPHTLAQAALKWTLSQPGVVAALAPVSSEAQLAEFAAAPDQPDLRDEDLDRLRLLLDSGFAPETPVADAVGAR